ncbi:MAG: hypothetical protein VW373_09655, partial [Halieaceae bacterium]
MSDKPTSSTQELLLICGMHRSGTSLVTHCFELFGYGLGDNLMEPGEDNPTGFFEDLDVVAINDALLLENGSAWDAPVFVESARLDWSARILKEAVATLKEKLVLAPRLAIKDPRVCLTLPFWREAASELGVSLRLCLVYRNPLDIAASIERRNGLPLSQGLALTQLYWSALMQQTSADEFVVDYREFVADPNAALEKLSSWLTFPPSDALLGPFLEQFVDPALQHHDHTRTDAGGAQSSMPEGLHQMAELMQKRAAGASLPKASWQKASHADPEAAQALFAYQLAGRVTRVEVLTEKIAELELSISHQQFELDSLNRQREERDDAIAVLEEKLVATNAQLEGLKLEKAQAIFELEDIQAQKRERETHISSL